MVAAVPVLVCTRGTPSGKGRADLLVLTITLAVAYFATYVH
jgi:hypothetical protein